MPDLSTTYLGLSLKNPIVVASSGLTGSLKGVEKCAAAGAGAVVLKSLFEEQIMAEVGALVENATDAAYGEGAEYLQRMGMDLGPRDYLDLVGRAKKAVDIPVIASINCASGGRWADYARQLEQAGADAIELNIAPLPRRPRQSAAEVEEIYYRVLHEVRRKVSLPVAVKVGPAFTAFAQFAERLTRDRAEAPDFMVGWCGGKPEKGRIVWRGADGLVLFNRFFPFDIDIETLAVATGSPYSTPAEIHVGLRWVSLLAGRIDADLAAATGIHDGRDVVKQLLAGARVVQVCSTLYRQGLDYLPTILQDLGDWMEGHGFATVGQFRGRLSQGASDHPEEHERLQYIRLLGGGR